MVQGDDELGKFLRFKFINKHGEIRNYYRKSSIWAGIKQGLLDIRAKTQWALYDRKKVDFWGHNWVGNKSLQEALNLSDAAVRGLKGNLEEFCSEGELNWPPYVRDLLAEAGLDSQNVVEADQCDNLHWLPELDGQFSSSTYNEI